MSPIDSFQDLKESLLSLEPGKSPGSGGMRPEYLVALGERLEPEEIILLEQFSMSYVRGELPAWFYKLWSTMLAVPLYKSEEKDSCRPLAIRHTLTRLWHGEVARQNKGQVRNFLEPQQLGSLWPELPS